jgi:hypothetical protein
MFVYYAGAYPLLMLHFAVERLDKADLFMS